MRRVVLVAGASGSGKSRLARLTGATHLALDEFYRDLDEPGLPRTAFGIVDWDDAASWDAAAALDALERLLDDGRATIPVYSIAESRRVGAQEVTAEPGAVIVAEGVFAVEMLIGCRERGLAVEALLLDRPRSVVFAMRLARDLAERRKPPAVLVRRGWALWRTAPALRARMVAAGFRPVTMRAALALMRRDGNESVHSARSSLKNG